MIYELPLEPIEQRYTQQWRTWFKIAFLCSGQDFRRIDGGVRIAGQSDDTISKADFLDPVATNLFKAEQTARLIYAISSDALLRPGETTRVFFHDLWHPVVTQLLYLRDVGKLPIWIGGILHAGSYDPHDRLAAYDKWVRPLELSWFNQADLIVVATEYHRRLLLDKVVWAKDKVRVMPFPVDMGRENYYARTPKVAFPHRITPEKQPEKFDELMRYLNDETVNDGEHIEGIKTIEVALSKDHYYTLLGGCQVAFSAALQETFGIAQIEATTRGCIPLVPNALAYVEQYPRQFRYADMDEAKEKCYWFIRDYAQQIVSPVYTGMCDRFRALHQTSKACDGIVSLVTAPG